MSQTIGSRSSFFRAFARRASASVEEAQASLKNEAKQKSSVPTKMAKKISKEPVHTASAQRSDDLEQVEVEQVMQQEKLQKPAELSHPIQGRISPEMTLSRQILHDLRIICRGVGRLIEVYLLWVVAYTIMERLAPGLTGEISANLTEVWRVLCPAVRPEGFHLGWAFFHPWEAVWNWIANSLPFLG